MNLDTETYRGYTIEIWRDEHVDNPREWCNLGTLALKGSGWAEHGIDDQESFFALLLESEDYLKYSHEDRDYDRYNIDHGKAQRRIEEKYIVLPVFKFEHSNVAYNTSGFSCPWDSGQNGYIYASKEDVRKEYSVKNISPRIRKLVIGVLESEVKTFSDAVNGNVYGYTVIAPDGEQLDSCGGYYGDYDESGLMEQAKAGIDSDIDQNRKRKLRFLKEWIINKVPLLKRQELTTQFL